MFLNVMSSFGFIRGGVTPHSFLPSNSYIWHQSKMHIWVLRRHMTWNEKVSKPLRHVLDQYVYFFAMDDNICCIVNNLTSGIKGRYQFFTHSKQLLQILQCVQLRSVAIGP